jgi:hypothetical protein
MGNGRRLLAPIAPVVIALAVAVTANADGGAEDVGPLLAKHCHACHSGAKPKAGLDLAHLSDPAAADCGPDLWERIVAQLEARTMPPEDRPQPTAAEAGRIGRWASDGPVRSRAWSLPDPPLRVDRTVPPW